MKRQYAAFDLMGRCGAIALFLGKISFRTNNEQPKISNTGAVHSGIIDLIQHPMAQREPDGRPGGKRSTQTALCARRPTRLNSWIAGSKIDEGGQLRSPCYASPITTYRLSNMLDSDPEYIRPFCDLVVQIVVIVMKSLETAFRLPRLT